MSSSDIFLKWDGATSMLSPEKLLGVGRNMACTTLGRIMGRIIQKRNVTSSFHTPQPFEELTCQKSPKSARKSEKYIENK